MKMMSGKVGVRRLHGLAKYLALAALSVIGANIPSNAVQISPTGEGEALIFPYYTVQNGAVTLLSLVNSSDTSKLVRINFQEGKNAAEALDVHVYLARNDVWTGAIIGTRDSVTLISNDESCITGRRFPAAGLPFSIGTQLSDRVGLRTIERVREGHVQVLVGADIVRNSETDRAISLGQSGQRSCEQTSLPVRARLAADYVPPTGGLLGSATIVGNSLSSGYQAVALSGMGYGVDNFALPFSLARATSTQAVIHESEPSGGSRMLIADFDSTFDALQAVLMRASMRAEYSTDSILATDWVVTAPTKRVATSFVPVARAPFQNVWNGSSPAGDGTACDEVRYTLSDREGRAATSAEGYLAANLCWVTNVISVSPSSTSGSVVDSANRSNFPVSMPSEGTGRIDLTNDGSATKRIVSKDTSKIYSVSANGVMSTQVGPILFQGLPLVGVSFSAAKFSRSQENYGSATPILGVSAVKP